MEEPEGFCTEAALYFFYIGLSLYLVLIVVSLSMDLTGHERQYKARRSMSINPDVPWCECGRYKRQKSKGGLRHKLSRCRNNKDSSAATQAATGSSSDAETEAGPSQQQEGPSSTLRRSSGSVLSPTPTVRGPQPTGCRWDGASCVSDANVTRERQLTASLREGRGVQVSTLQPSWLTDFMWLYCAKDPDLTAQTAGRCRTESEDGVACPGCTQCSRLYCRECRNRTGSVFSAAIGGRTFKHAECARHAQGCHRKKRRSHSVPTLLTKEAEKAKQSRVRTILAVPFLTVENVALHKRPAQAKLVFQMGLRTSDSDDAHDNLNLGLRLSRPGRKQACRRRRSGGGRGRETKMRRSSGSLSGQILGL